MELDDRVYTPPPPSLYVLNTISEVEKEEGSLCGPASFLHLPPKWNSLSGVHTHTQEEEIQQRRSTSQRKKEKKKTRRVKANIHKRLATLMRGNVNAKMLYTSLIIKCVSCSQHTHTTYHLSLEKKKCVLNNIQPKSLPLVPPIHSDVF